MDTAAYVASSKFKNGVNSSVCDHIESYVRLNYSDWFKLEYGYDRCIKDTIKHVRTFTDYEWEDKTLWPMDEHALCVVIFCTTMIGEIFSKHLYIEEKKRTSIEMVVNHRGEERQVNIKLPAEIIDLAERLSIITRLGSE